jgi:hypothetical protein
VRLDIHQADKANASDVSTSGELVIENEFMKVTLDAKTSSVTSIYSKALKREIVRQDSVVGFNAHIYDEYASSGGFNHQSGRTEGNLRLDLLATRNLNKPGVVIDRGRNSVKEWITIESYSKGSSWIRSTYTLRKGVDRLDINNRIYKEATMTKESGFFAFPFALEAATARVEVSGGMTGTGLPRVPGSALHMQAARRWVSFEDSEIAVAVALHDAPLIQLGGVALPFAPFPQTMGDPEPATVYSWFHNNIWDTNFPSQQGFEMNFRYSVGVSAVKGKGAGPALGTRISAGTGRPIRASLSTANSGKSIDVEGLFEINDARVRAVGLTSPKSGHLLVRLQSFAEEPITLKLKVNKKFTSAQRASFLGEPLGELSLSNGEVEVSMERIGVGAVLLKFA